MSHTKKSLHLMLLAIILISCSSDDNSSPEQNVTGGTMPEGIVINRILIDSIKCEWFPQNGRVFNALDNFLYHRFGQIMYSNVNVKVGNELDRYGLVQFNFFKSPGLTITVRNIVDGDFNLKLISNWPDSRKDPNPCNPDGFAQPHREYISDIMILPVQGLKDRNSFFVFRDSICRVTFFIEKYL
jgi:hypothetical protein